MRRLKTSQMQVTVYLFQTVDDAELVFRKLIREAELGCSYRWSGQMGSIDIDKERTYCMTNEYYIDWEKTHRDFKLIRAKLNPQFRKQYDKIRAKAQKRKRGEQNGFNGESEEV